MWQKFQRKYLVLFVHQVKPHQHPTAQQMMIILLVERPKTLRPSFLTLNNVIHLDGMIIGHVRSDTYRIEECRHTLLARIKFILQSAFSDCLTPHKCATLSLQIRQEPHYLNTYNNTPIRQRHNNAFLIEDCYT